MSGARKRVILMLVEGTTDALTFEQAFMKFFDERNRRFEAGDPFRCDITTIRLFPKDAKAAKLPVGDAPALVADRVRDHIRRSELYSLRDFSSVVQLIDLDGAFIPEKAVIETSGSSKDRYTESSILTVNRDGTLRRLAEKRRQIGLLLRMDAVKADRRTILPYRVFFMSRNLEHAMSHLAGRINQSDKRKLAADLAFRYKDDPDLLMNDLRDLLHVPDGSDPGDWLASWRYVMEGVHSLERGSNLALMPEFALHADRTTITLSKGK